MKLITLICAGALASLVGCATAQDFNPLNPETKVNPWKNYKGDYNQLACVASQQASDTIPAGCK